MSKGKRLRNNSTPLWVIQQLAREFGLPQWVVRNAPVVVDLVQSYLGNNWQVPLPIELPEPFSGPGTAVDQRVPEFNPIITDTEEEKKKNKNIMIHQGLYAGRFKQPKPNPKPKTGITQKRTDGGEKQASNASTTAYGGFTPVTPDNMKHGVLLAVLRRLSAKMGSPFITHQDKVNTQSQANAGAVGTFHYIFSYDDHSFVEERTIQVSQNMTWYGLATTWWSNINSFFSSHQSIIMKKCMLFGKTATGSETVLIPLASLNLQNAKLHYSLSSTVTIQNRTGAADDTDDQTDVIDANPLRGTLYLMKGAGCQLSDTNEISYTPVPPAVVIDTRADETTGVVTLDVENWGTDSGIPAQFQLPPSKSMFARCYKTSVITLNPGEMKKNTIHTSGTMSLDKFMTRHLMMLVESGSRKGNQDFFGDTQLFALRKACTTGAGTAKSKFGYSHHQFHWFDISLEKHRGFITQVLNAS